jgi:hypothetical protein
MLVDAKADAGIKDGDGATALELAKDEGYIELVAYISAHGA